MNRRWVFAATVVLAVSCALAGLPTMAVDARAAQDKASHGLMAKGELVKVDEENKTLTIRAENGPLEFSYDSSTKVEGATTGVQGLASKAGTHLTVYYDEESGRKLATWIKINPAK